MQCRVKYSFIFLVALDYACELVFFHQIFFFQTSDSCLTCLTRSTDTLRILPFCNELSFSVKVVRGAGVGMTECECGVFAEFSAQLSLCRSESSELHSVEDVQSLALFLLEFKASTLWLLLLEVK